MKPLDLSKYDHGDPRDAHQEAIADLPLLLAELEAWRKLGVEIMETLDGLSEQQAMPDDWWIPTLHRVAALLPETQEDPR